MLLISLPQEVLLVVLAVGEFRREDLSKLGLTCRAWAEIAFERLWRERSLSTQKEADAFKTAVRSKRFYPYGTFVHVLTLYEVQKTDYHTIEDHFVEFLADECPNLHELRLRFGSSKRKVPVGLPLSRFEKLRLLETSGYENTNSDPHQLVEQDSIINLAKQRGIKELFMLYPITHHDYWGYLCDSAGQSLEWFDLMIDSDPNAPFGATSLLEHLAQHCTSLRHLKLDLLGLITHPTVESLRELLGRCTKLLTLKLALPSEAVPFLHESTSLTSLELPKSSLPPINGEDLNQFGHMKNLRELKIGQIEGKCSFKFLCQMPCLDYLQVEQFPQLNDDTMRNITGHPRISQLEFKWQPVLTDKHFGMLAAMPSLTTMKIGANLQHITRDGWLLLLRRPRGCPSWHTLEIKDGQLLDGEHFEILANEHPDLKHLHVLNINRNRFPDDAPTYSNARFRETWKISRDPSKPKGDFIWPAVKRGS